MTLTESRRFVEPHRAAELRELSARARTSVDALGVLAERIGHDPRLDGVVVTRPHPLLVMVRRGPYAALLAPAVVWDKGRELLEPYADRFAAYEMRLLLLGR